MFKSDYKILFSVVVENIYYANHTGMTGSAEADFDWIPAPSTVLLCKRYGLIFRKVPTGFIVLATGVKGVDNKWITKLPNGSELLFVMRLRNPLVPAITDLPTAMDVQQPLFFFSTKNVHTEAGVDRHNLPVTKSLSVQPTDQLQQADQRANLLKLIGTLANGLVFGTLEVIVDYAQPELYRLIGSDGVLTDERPVFKVRFQNRKSRWRYDIQISTPDVAVDELIVQHLPDFSKQIINQNHIRFVSDTATETLERQPDPKPSIRLAYRANVSTGSPPGGIGIERFLPYPSPGSLRTETDSITQVVTVYSDVLITI